MARVVTLPVRLDLEVSGTARVDPAAPEPLLDELLGAGPDTWGVAATSTARLPGDLEARASSAFDGDLSTAWQTPLSSAVGQAIEVELAEPASMDTLELDVVADSRHSLPSELRVVAGDDEPITLTVPAIEDPAPKGVAHLSLDLPRSVTSRSWRIEISA